MANMDEADPLGKLAPYIDAIPVVASDTVDFAAGHCRAIRCKTVGTFVGVTRSGNTRTIQMFAAGEVLQLSFKRINATGTTGTYDALY